MTARAGLYVHVPFCSAICPYCDFAVTTGRRDRDAPGFVDSVLAEFASAPFPHEFDTVYLGGGTPSWLGRDQLARLVEGVRADPRVIADVAVHVEANPEDVTIELAACWSDLGVAFLSLGVQSFDDEELTFLGRAHDANDARLAVSRCRDAGIPTVSIDVIYGLPSRTAADVTRTLEEAARTGAEHLSCYQLTVHEDTPFHRMRDRGALVELDDEHQGDLFRHVHAEAGRLGHAAYEVSNFATSYDHRSRHNSKYWRHDPYLGVGPSAHSFDGRDRWWNARTFGEWSRRLDAGESPIEGRERLAAEDLALEHVMLGLRTREGVDFDALARTSGLRPTPESRGRIEFWYERGLATSDAGRVMLTLAGWSVADALVRQIDLEAVR